MWVTPPKAHWGSIPWHPRSPGRVLSGPSPGVGYVGAGWTHLYQSSVSFLSTGVCDSSVHPCCLGKPAAGDEQPTRGAVPWIMHNVSAWGDGAKVVLECMLVADLKIPSPSLVTLGLFGDRGVGGTSVPNSPLQADVRKIGATLPFEWFIMLLSWDHFNTAELLSTYLESAVLLRNGFPGQFSIKVDCLHSQNITSGWVFGPCEWMGMFITPSRTSAAHQLKERKQVPTLPSQSAVTINITVQRGERGGGRLEGTGSWQLGSAFQITLAKADSGWTLTGGLLQIKRENAQLSWGVSSKLLDRASKCSMLRRNGWDGQNLRGTAGFCCELQQNSSQAAVDLTYRDVLNGWAGLVFTKLSFSPAASSKVVPSHTPSWKAV